MLLPAVLYSRGGRGGSSTACGVTSALVVMSALDLPILVDAKTGSIWGDSTVIGQSCTDACQADGGKECDATAFDEVDSEKHLEQKIACEDKVL